MDADCGVASVMLGRLIMPSHNIRVYCARNECLVWGR